MQYVMVRDVEHECYQYQETNLVDPVHGFFRNPGLPFRREAFEDQAAAVECREWQEVYDGKVDRNKRHERQERSDPERERSTGEFRDADGT